MVRALAVLILFAAPPMRGRVVNPEGTPIEVSVTINCHGQPETQRTVDGGTFAFRARKGPCEYQVADIAGHPPKTVRCARTKPNWGGETVIILPRLPLHGPDGSCQLPIADGGYEKATGKRCTRAPGCR